METRNLLPFSARIAGQWDQETTTPTSSPEWLGTKGRAISMLDTYHDDIIAFYRDLQVKNTQEVEELAKNTTPVCCGRCRHMTQGHCDIAKVRCDYALVDCENAGWYESGVVMINRLENSVPELNGRRTKKTGECVEDE
jgi:hypothetical protein